MLYQRHICTQPLYTAFLFTAIGGKSNEKPLHTELEEARAAASGFAAKQGDSAQKHFVYFKENQRSTAGKDPFIVRINSFKPRAI